MKKEYALFWIAGTLFLIAGSLFYWNIAIAPVFGPCFLILGLGMIYSHLSLFDKEICREINLFFIRNCLFLSAGLIVLGNLSLRTYIELPKKFVIFEFILIIVLLLVNLLYWVFNDFSDNLLKEED